MKSNDLAAEIEGCYAAISNKLYPKCATSRD
jgi:hypothetical protein